MIHWASALLLLLTFERTPAEPLLPVEGLLCLGAAAADGSCPPVRRMSVLIEPQKIARPFVWTRRDGEEVVVGIAAADATAVDLLPANDSIRAIIALDPSRWPAGVTVQVKAAEGNGDRLSWVLRDTASVFAMSVTGLPRGTYTLEISAGHHRRITQTVTIARGSRDLGRIALPRLPVITGRVVDRASGAAALGATVELLDGKVAAVIARADGAFELEIEDQWPDALLIRRTGFATRIVPLPKMQADTALNAIELLPGVALRAALRLPPNANALSAELFLVDEQAQTRRRVASKDVSPDATALVFESLPAGSYLLVLRGREALQRYAAAVEVEEDKDANASIEIRPIAFEIAVTQRGAPVAGASVAVRNRTAPWETSVAVNDTGRYGSELWQGGRFTATVELDGRSFFAETNVSGASAEWNIAIPEHRVSGTVSDAKTKKAVAGATVFLRTELPDSSTLTRTTTDETGHFAFAWISAGPQSVTVNAPGFLSQHERLFVDDSHDERSVAIALRRATRKSMRVLLASGAPAVGALIVTEGAGPSTPIETDAGGRAEVTAPEGGVLDLWVAPREGSFAPARVSSDGNAEAVITVAPGDAAIYVRAQDQQGNGIPGVHLLMRYGGRVLPAGVLRDVAAQQGRSLITGPDGMLVLTHMPLGIYELWPYFRGSRAPGDAPTENAPARIAVQPGPNEVTMTFARR